MAQDQSFDALGQPIHRYLGAASIAHGVKQSLKRLGTDVIDHYVTHWQDPTTPIAETMARNGRQARWSYAKNA